MFDFDVHCADDAQRCVETKSSRMSWLRKGTRQLWHLVSDPFILYIEHIYDKMCSNHCVSLAQYTDVKKKNKHICTLDLKVSLWKLSVLVSPTSWNSYGPVLSSIELVWESRQNIVDCGLVISLQITTHQEVFDYKIILKCKCWNLLGIYICFVMGTCSYSHFLMNAVQL